MPGERAAVGTGIVVVDKPAGWTSHDVVARVRRLADTRRVGHAGTLDPMATGVLVLGVGRATRLLGHFASTAKTYDATIRLGAATNTDDADGELLGEADATDLSQSEVESAVAAFVGDIEQVPSAVSAVKVAGRRAYARVRAGESVELKARTVHIDAFTVHRLRAVPPYLDVDVTVSCSTGTYVRALARDLGATLGVGGHLTALRRTRVGLFTLSEAVTLRQLASRWRMIPVGEAVRRTFPAKEVTADQTRMVRHGQQLDDTCLAAEGPVGLFGPDGEFLALYEQRGSVAKAVAVFAD